MERAGNTISHGHPSERYMSLNWTSIVGDVGNAVECRFLAGHCPTPTPAPDPSRTATFCARIAALPVERAFGATEQSALWESA